MHRRFVGRDAASNGGNGSGVSKSADSIQRLERLDIYARPKQEFQRGTLHGGMVTVVLLAAVVVLTWRELVFSMKTETVERLFVNSTISPTFNVTFDVVFSRIACGMISLDAEDSLGIPQEGLRHDVTRTRLDLEGRPVGVSEKHDMGNTLKGLIATEEAKSSDASKEGESGAGGDDCNCYGAGAEGECCRTCQEVKAAYRRKGWKLDTSAVPVCAGKSGGDGSTLPGGTVVEDVEDNEGCRLAGSLEVSKTEGNFHFAPGHTLHRRANALSLMERIQVSLESFNTSHTIHALSFGDQPPAGHASPKHAAASAALDGHQKTVQDTHAMHQYFLQLVPTVYRLANGATVYSNQYSATEHLKHVHAGPSRGLPGVYFYYEVSPVQALVEERRPGFLAFLTGACGVVGGVYMILGLVNSGIDGLLSGLRKGRSR